MNTSKIALRTAVIYVLVSIVWIFIDKSIILKYIIKPEYLMLYDTIKDIFFLLAVFIFFTLLYREKLKNNKAENDSYKNNIIDLNKEREDRKNIAQSFEELCAVYEQLTATEEELRAQCQELEYNQQVLSTSEERYKLAVEGSNDVIWEWNLENGRIFTSSKWFDLTGYKEDEFVYIKNAFDALVNKDDKGAVLDGMKLYLRSGSDFYNDEYRIKAKNGEEKWILVRGKALRRQDGEAFLMAGSFTDVTERKNKEQQITQMAYYDAVTGLPNKALFTEKLEEQLSKGEESKGLVLFLDLDDFKTINDTLGHDYGDELLRSTANQLLGCVSHKDIAARFGGDEFLILIPEIDEPLNPISIADEILKIFKEPFYIKEKQIYVTASIGLIAYPEDGKTASIILKNVDAAMYSAKSGGKNQYYFFDQCVSDTVERTANIEKGLRQALKRNEFYIFYQPQVDIKNGKVVGFEALIRWKNGEIGFVSPMEFIPVAEKTSLINDIGEWVLKNACVRAKKWLNQGYEFGTISVNVSAIQLQQKNFVQNVFDILKETELEPNCLEIEITESVFMQNLQKNVDILYKLREIGIRVALDDFGTGYSSLSYLRKLPIDTLKIDKSFIDEILENENDKEIADGIIQLAHKINVSVVAEGVETAEQAALLHKMNCNIIQGYHFSKPVEEHEAEEILKKGQFEVGK